jgi:hypothetical protein
MLFKKCKLFDYRAIERLRRRVGFESTHLFDYLLSLYYYPNSHLIGAFTEDNKMVGYLHAVDGKYTQLPIKQEEVSWYNKLNKTHIQTIVVDPLLSEVEQRQVLNGMLMKLEVLSKYQHIDIFLEIRDNKLKRWIYRYGYITEGIIDTDSDYDLVILGRHI